MNDYHEYEYSHIENLTDARCAAAINLFQFFRWSGELLIVSRSEMYRAAIDLEDAGLLKIHREYADGRVTFLVKGAMSR